MTARLLIHLGLITGLTACAGGGADPDPNANGAPGDADGDGVEDALEVAGWTVRIEGDGADRTVEVQSDPNRADTDGDGLDDGVEYRLRLDPTRADTDGDGLSDADEVLVYRSLGHHVDSDGDSGGDRLFWDGNEVAEHGTSPALADTDGDGLDDRAEVMEWGTHPRIADMARLEVRLKVPVVEVTGSRTDGESVTFGISNSMGIDWSRSTSRTHSVSESLALARSLNGSIGGGVEGGVGLDALKASLNGTFGGSLQETQTTEMGYALTAQEARAISQSATQSRSESSSRSVTLDGGYVGVTADLVNTGRVPLTLAYASLTALRRNPLDRSQFMPVAGLERDSHLSGFPAQTLAPGEAVPDVYFINDRLDYRDVLPLLDNPGSLTFRLSGAELVDASGTAFGHRQVSTRTAAITIDRGLESEASHTIAHLATKTRFDPLTDAPTGITIAEALALLGVPFNTEPGTGRLHMLDDITPDPAAPAQTGWAAILVRAHSTTPEVIGADFDALVLQAGDHLRLIYDEDRDADGLGYRTERRFGTRDDAVDTDGDGLSDRLEALDGWVVSTTPERRAYADPTRNVDVDEDGLDDPAEHAAGTDPLTADTDGDGLLDGMDPDPTAPDGVALNDLRGFQDVDARQLSLTWNWPDSAAITELVWVRQMAAVDGSFATLPTPSGVLVDGQTVGDASVAFLSADRGIGRFDDADVQDGARYRYTAWMRHGDHWLPGGVLELQFARPQGLTDRLAVQLLALQLQSDDCDPGSGDPELYWQLGVNGQVHFNQGVAGAVEVDGVHDLSYVQAVEIDQPHDQPLRFGGWMRDRDSFDNDDDLGEQYAEFTHGDGWQAGVPQWLSFVDQAEGAEKCRVDLMFQVDLIEADRRP